MSIAVGDQVQASSGYWTPEPTGYTYQWQSSANGVSLDANIGGATRSDYVTRESDVGQWLRVATVASNVVGDSAAAYSEWIGPVGVPRGLITEPFDPPDNHGRKRDGQPGGQGYGHNPGGKIKPGYPHANILDTSTTSPAFGNPSPGRVTV